jgi:uncharacterized membrane protein YkoI
MRFRTKVLTGAAGAALLITGGIGVVGATTSNDGGDAAINPSAPTSGQTTNRDQSAAGRDERDDRPLGGTVAERAKAAATAAVPGATVRQVERDRDDDFPRAAYEVELVKRDGSSAEVKLDANFKVLDIDRDRPNDRDDCDD